MRTTIISAVIVLGILGIVGSMMAVSIDRGREDERIENVIVGGGDPAVLLGLLRGPGVNAHLSQMNAPKDCVRHVFQRDHTWTTALAFAVQSAQFIYVKPLLDAGANPNMKDGFGTVPMDAMPSTIAGPNPRRALSDLLDHGADPNVVSANETTPLMRAAQNGDIAAIKILLAHHADPNFEDPITHKRPIDFINFSNRPDLMSGTVQALVAGGADLSRKSSDGLTYIQHARRDFNMMLAAILVTFAPQPGHSARHATTH